MKRGTPSSPPVPVGGGEGGLNGAGKAAVEGAAAMISLSIGTSSSTSYLHSSRRHAPRTSSSISSIPGIVGVAAGVARRGIITAPVTGGTGVACQSNSPTAPTGEDASFIIERGVVLMGSGAGGRGESWSVGRRSNKGCVSSAPARPQPLGQQQQ